MFASVSTVRSYQACRCVVASALVWVVLPNILVALPTRASPSIFKPEIHWAWAVWPTSSLHTPPCLFLPMLWRCLSGAILAREVQCDHLHVQRRHLRPSSSGWGPQRSRLRSLVSAPSINSKLSLSSEFIPCGRNSRCCQSVCQALA